MTITEARAAIGQPFKLSWIHTTGGAGRFDIIRRVDENGTVYGDFLEAPACDVRLKLEQPLQLKNSNDERKKIQNV